MSEYHTPRACTATSCGRLHVGDKVSAIDVNGEIGVVTCQKGADTFGVAFAALHLAVDYVVDYAEFNESELEKVA